MKARSVTQKPAEDYTALFRARVAAQGPDISRIRQAQAYVNNDIELTLSGLEKSDKPTVANLADQGARNLAQRVASIEPASYFPSLKLGDKAEDEASINRGRVVTGWRNESDMRLRNAQRARHLLVYASCPVVVKPNPQTGTPFWYVRHPLETFPSDGDFFQFIPDNCIFATQHSYRWFLKRYPDCAKALSKPNNWDEQNPDMDAKFTLIEYLDEYEDTMIAIGAEGGDPAVGSPTVEPSSHILESEVNWACITPCVIPGSINLDKVRGHFDGIFGMYHARAVLMALSLVATKNAIFPPAWAVANPGEVVDVVQVPDPYHYQPGEINGGKIEYMRIDPTLQGVELGAQMEYAERMTAGLPPEFGGMSQTNVRTGRRGSQIMANTIDYTISESQDIFAKSTRHEIELGIEIDKAYFNRKKKYHIISHQFSGVVEYKPSTLWGKHGNKVMVSYPMGGVDLQNLPIEGGQRMQMRTMSRKRFMQMDPAIPDEDAEMQQLAVEAIDDGIYGAIASLGQNPEAFGLQLPDLAVLKKHVLAGMAPEDALLKVQEAAQKRQATMVPPGSPQAQPGLATPGMGVEQPSPTGPGSSMQDMATLLGQLGTVQQAQKFRSTNGSI